EKKADYVLALKGNKGALYDDVVDYLEERSFQTKIKRAGDYKKTVEKAHGQIETREYYQTSDISWLENREKWPKLASIGMVKTTVEKHNKIQVESRYYISSLSVDIEQFSKAIREHWAIESMHWHLDVSFGEDANKTLDKTAALNHSNIRKLALAVLKDLEMRKKKMSIRLKRFSLSMTFPDYLAQLFSM
ncbi:ISAs1 family transposase, partial [Pseudolactococcus yaeyamensis]